MHSVSLLRRVLKVVSLLIVSIGICLHVFLQYQSPFLAALVCAAIVVIDAICIWVIWPHAEAHKRSSTLQPSHR